MWSDGIKKCHQRGQKNHLGSNFFPNRNILANALKKGGPPSFGHPVYIHVLGGLSPPARASRVPTPLPLSRSCSTQNRNPPSSVPTPSRGLHHLERFALFIVKYDKEILLSSPHHYEVKKWRVFLTFNSAEILPQLDLI